MFDSCMPLLETVGSGPQLCRGGSFNTGRSLLSKLLPQSDSGSAQVASSGLLLQSKTHFSKKFHAEVEGAYKRERQPAQWIGPSLRNQRGLGLWDPQQAPPSHLFISKMGFYLILPHRVAVRIQGNLTVMYKVC